jgi:hypothetical protein
MLKLLSTIKTWDQEQLHVITTSRWNNSIEASMLSIATGTLRLDQLAAMDGDISLYIISQLKNDPRLAQWPPDVQQTIRETLLYGSHGM